MSGQLNGVRAKLTKAGPDALYVHCSCHALDLILQEAARKVKLIAYALNFVQEASVATIKSLKQTTLCRN